MISETETADSADSADSVDAIAVTLPDRANAPVSVVTERFFRAVVAQVPLDRIEELHLFSPLRQGLAETGIAVIAARTMEEQVPLDPESVSEPPVPRHTVFTARYRLVLKGPERGKWEADVVAEAEAPLLTVETVVRGVQRRAGEDSEIVRFGASQIAHALQLVWPPVLPDVDVSNVEDVAADVPDAVADEVIAQDESDAQDEADTQETVERA